ncbi:MAG: DUF6356 family protein [Rhodospirillales bacterium]
MIHELFTEHPGAVGESYFQHQRAAFSYAIALLSAGLAAALHGLLPCLYETTASRTVARLHASMSARHARPGVLPTGAKY